LNRRTFLRATAAAALAAAVPGGCRRGAGDVSNLLFVMADQWRFSAVGHASAPAPVATPHLDRLARQGLRCNRAYVANPVCAPSRASVMTGRLPHQHGLIVNQLTLPPGERGFAESFARAGYRTHYVGKWHLDGPDSPGFVPPGWRRRGFETFEGFNRGHWYQQPQTFTDAGELIHPEAREWTYQTDRAIDFVRRHRDERFFCFLSWGPPHPATLGRPRSQRFAEAPPPWRANVPERVRRRGRLAERLGAYYDLCEQLDVELGRLLDALDEQGLAESTLVVFTSDHGDMLGSHGVFYKEHPYEESVRVPLVLRQPGRIAAGGETDTLVSNVDLMPTLTRLAGLERPSTCTGRDLSGVLGGSGSASVASVYCEGRMDGRRSAGPQLGRGAWRAVITPSHKLMVDETGAVVLLVDLERDPLELENLAGRGDQRDLAESLRAELDRWRARTADAFPKPPVGAKSRYEDVPEPA